MSASYVPRVRQACPGYQGQFNLGKEASTNLVPIQIDEVGQILAAGLSRIQRQQSRSLSAPTRESCVDILALKSGVRRRKRRN